MTYPLATFPPLQAAGVRIEKTSYTIVILVIIIMNGGGKVHPHRPMAHLTPRELDTQSGPFTAGCPLFTGTSEKNCLYFHTSDQYGRISE